MRAAGDRFGAILPHPGVGIGDMEGELPTHPEVEAGAHTKEPVASGAAAPYGTLLRILAGTGQIDPAELANLIYAAVGESPRPSARRGGGARHAAGPHPRGGRSANPPRHRRQNETSSAAQARLVQAGWGNGVPGAGM